MRVLIAASAALMAVACTPNDGGLNSTPVPPQENLVPLSSIVNAIKCELAETFATGKFDQTVVSDSADGKDVVASLTFGEVFSAKNTGEASASIPLGIEVGLSGSGYRNQSSGQSFKLSFDYDLVKDARVPAFCADLAEELKVEGDPFADMLTAVETEYARIEAGEPKVKLRTIDYTSDFSVEKSVTGGVSVNLLIFKFGTGRSQTTKTSQSLTLNFKIDKLPQLAPL